MERALRAEIELLTDNNLELALQRARTLVEAIDEDPHLKGGRSEARARMRLRVCEEEYTKRGIAEFSSIRTVKGFNRPFATLGDLIKVKVQHVDRTGSGRKEGRDRAR